MFFYNDIISHPNIPLFKEKGAFFKLFQSCRNLDSHPCRTLKLDSYVDSKNDSILRDEEVKDIQRDILCYIFRKFKSTTYEEYVELIDKCKNEGSDHYLPSLIGENLKSKEFFNKLKNLTDKQILKFENIADENVKEFIKKIYKDSCDLKDEHNFGPRFLFPVKDMYSRSESAYNAHECGSVRIYLNGPNFPSSKHGKFRDTFLSIFIKKCIDRNLSYDMKGYGAGQSSIDNIVLYVARDKLNEYTEILDEIARENPDLVAMFGSPIATGHNVCYKTKNKDKDGKTIEKPYYAICTEPGMFIAHATNDIKKQKIEYLPFTYNDYTEFLSKRAFFSVIAQELMETELFTDFHIPEMSNPEFYKTIEKLADETYLGTEFIFEHEQNLPIIKEVLKVFERQVGSQYSDDDLYRKFGLKFRRNFTSFQKSFSLKKICNTPGNHISGAGYFLARGVETCFDADGVLDVDDGVVKDIKENDFPLCGDKHLRQMADKEIERTRTIMDKLSPCTSLNAITERTISKVIDEFGIDEVINALYQTKHEIELRKINDTKYTRILGTMSGVLFSLRKKRSSRLLSEFNSSENKPAMLRKLSQYEKEDLANGLGIKLNELLSMTTFESGAVFVLS